MSKRIFDTALAVTGLVILFPFMLIIALWIIPDTKGKIIYRQKRVGKEGHDFYLFKFRTMVAGADKKGLITVGNDDQRITSSGQFLRKYKLDELPQLINILSGRMSFVGPRPEVRKYVELYNEKQKKVLSVKPGLTDYASLEYFNENELLSGHSDPEKLYIEKIMPAKLEINLRYITNRSFNKDILILLKTLKKILFSSK